MIRAFRCVGGQGELKFWLVGCLFSWIISTAIAQEERPASDDIPFRRVFVPHNDLRAIGVSDFTPIDIKLLDELLRKHALNSQTELAKQRVADINESVQLRSAFYVAKLIGADLVSEQSRLTLMGDRRLGDRLDLVPWSLAIQSSPPNSVVQEPQFPVLWAFNERGEPRLRVASENISAGGSKGGQFETTFGWSAKADSSSTPNKLKFSLEVPNCVNSCLVLALPPQAEVHDSLTVVQRVEDWSQIERRLSSWKDFAKEGRRDASTGLNSESLWLIELGGSQSATFSISLRADNRSQDAQANGDGRRYEQLVRSQTLQHFIEGHEIRTVCDAEVLVSPLSPTLRLRLEPQAKLRRLTVNQVDVDWKVQEDWIVVEGGVSVLELNSGNYANVMAEFVSTFATDQLGKVETPNPSFDHSYVMSGTTVVVNSSPWRLSQVNCEASRMVQPIEDTRTTSVNRIEYAWSAQPPKLSFGLEQTFSTRRCETLTRLSNDEIGTTAVVRAKLQFCEQDSTQTKVELQKGWRLRSFASMDPNDPVSISDDIDMQWVREVQLTWNRVQKSRVAEIELRLFREAEETVDQSRQVDSHSICHFPGWQRSDLIVVEQDELFQLEVRDALLDQMISEDMVSDWQRPLLPKSNKGNLFRLEMHAINTPMIWKKKLVRHHASTKTIVERTGESSIRAWHEIQLNTTSNRVGALAIDMPAKNVLWRRKDGEFWLPLSPLAYSPALETSESQLWWFDIQALGQTPLLSAIVTSEFQEGMEVVFDVPRVVDFEMVSQVAQSNSSDIMLACNQPSATWAINETGFKVLELPETAADTKLSVSAKALKVNPSEKWFVDASDLHVAVDSMGSQKALLTLHANLVSQGPLVIELENGWQPLAIRIQSSEGTKEIPVRLDGQRLVIARQNEVPSQSVTVEIDFAGPRLPRRSGLFAQRQGSSFPWPVFDVDAECAEKHRYLWLPLDLQLDGAKEQESGEGGHWMLWGWSKEVFRTLFGNADSLDSATSPDNFPALRHLIPSWESARWRLAMDVPMRGYGSVMDSRESLSIRPVSPDRTLLALCFGLAVLLTPRLLVLRYHAMTWVCVVLIVLAHFAPTYVSRFAFTGLTGIFFGFVGAILFELLFKRIDGDTSQSQRNSAKWSPWNDRQSEIDSGSNHVANHSAGGARANAMRMGALGLLFLACSAIDDRVALFHSIAVAQSTVGDEKESVYQVLVPIDDDGEMVGTTAYIPQGMLDSLTGKSDRAQDADRGTYPVSAKYSLRVGFRGRFNSADQLSMSYEFQVGDDLAPVRFPVNANQMLLPRFSVDGIELSLGNKLRSNGTFWTWTPDRPGKRTIQIVSQPVLKQVESDRSKDTMSQLLDIAILPTANATIEIQTDSKNSVDVVSKGRVTDPEGGRFVAMLGAVDRLICSLRPPMSKSPMSAATALESGEVPTMNTELFLQNDTLQAKTIVDFPRGHSFGPQVEMEADLQWLPVGSQWGDAQLVETRSGSNLFRRRYILEWKSPSNGGSTNAATVRDRQISVIWVPQTTTQSLNVLFADCLERGTRRGTLRFARSSPSWNIDGISKWIPAIGSKDRLDWPELKTNLPALSLRIPSNGGFGILKPKAISDKPQQARITTKWSIEQSRETVSIMIAWFGNSPTAEPLIVELPDDYQVTELYNRSGPIRFLQSTIAGKIRLQILADRKYLESSDLWIQARRLSDASEKADESQWRSMPCLELPGNIQSDQSLEIQASERIALNFESEPAMLYGKGLGVPIHLQQKSTSDSNLNASSKSRLKVIHRDDPLEGTLLLKLDSYSNPKEIEVQAQLSISIASRPFFVLEVPYSLKDRWQSESRVVSVPCPDENKAWLQVYLPESTLTPVSEATMVSTAVRFSLRLEDTFAGLDTIKGIRALDSELIPMQRIDSENWPKSSPGESRQVKSQSLVSDGVQPKVVPAVAMSIFQVRVEDFMPTQTKRFALLESQFWLANIEQNTSSHQELEWQVADAAEVLSIELNNASIPFWQQGNRIRCAWSPAGLSSDIRMFSKHELGATGAVKMTVEAPKLTGFIQGPAPIAIQSGISISLGGVELQQTEHSDAIGKIALTCLDVIEKSKRYWPNLDKVEPGSDFDAWRNHWGQKSWYLLVDWSDTVGTADQLAFGSAVEQWHSFKLQQVKPLLKHSKAEHIKFEHELPSKEPHSSPWFSFLGCLMLVAAVTWLTPAIGSFLVDRPWWCYLLLGSVAWLVTGSLVPALVLGTMGLVVAVDCYWMVISRLRRNEIRGPR